MDRFCYCKIWVKHINIKNQSFRIHRKAHRGSTIAIAGPSRDTTMLTVWVRRTPYYASCQGVLLGCFASFFFAFCSCLLIFCFRPLSLSFLPLSPIAYLLFPLFLIFSPRGRRCVVSSVFAYFHEYSCLTNIKQKSFFCYDLT